MAEAAKLKYVLVTGGVLSGVGKGVAASSIGVILKARGLRISHIKIDPYINIDAGCMSPYEHGEVFVLDDGGEVDLDLGNYERFGDLQLTRDNNITTGKVYQRVIERERRGDFLGKTVQVVPHITNEIQDWIERVANVSVDGSGVRPDVCIIELGGTVGDIESMPFVEAMRQFQFRVGGDNLAVVHVSLVPAVGRGHEQKSKPTQHSVKELRALGLSPDMLICRSDEKLDEDVRQKIAMFSHVKPSNCLGVHNLTNIYHVPDLLASQGTADFLLDRLALTAPNNVAAASPYSLDSWRGLANRVDGLTVEARVALVGKYTTNHDSYHSLIKAIEHAAFAVNRKLVLECIESTDLEEDMKASDPAKHAKAWEVLRGSHGVLVPGGFGARGFEGKILAAKYARENKKPYLGICLGMQVAVVEFARHVLNKERANSTEIDEATPHQVIFHMKEIPTLQMGATMRLGTCHTVIKDPNCRVAKLYQGLPEVAERHRHRYEVNPAYVPEFEAAGFSFVGHDRDGYRMEIIEIKDHPFYVGTQFHPEYLTRPMKPSPPYLGLLQAIAAST